MNGTDPVEMRLVLYLGLKGFRQLGKGGLRLNQVDDSQETVGIKNLLDVGTYLVGEDGEDTDYLATLLGFSRTRLLASTTSAGSMKTVFPVALSS